MTMTNNPTPEQQARALSTETARQIIDWLKREKTGYRYCPGDRDAIERIIASDLRALASESPAPSQEIERLREGIAWAYQLAGAVEVGSEALDNLSALSQGLTAPHEWHAASSPLLESIERLTAVLAEKDKRIAELEDAADTLCRAVGADDFGGVISTLNRKDIQIEELERIPLVPPTYCQNCGHVSLKGEQAAPSQEIVAQQQQEIERLREERDREKQVRIGYQDTVYAVCLELDKQLGNSPTKGQAVGSDKESVLAALTDVIRTNNLRSRILGLCDANLANEGAEQEIERLTAERDAATVEWRDAEIELAALRAERGALQQSAAESQQLAHDWMKRHDALLGFIQARSGLLKDFIEWRAALNSSAGTGVAEQEETRR